MVPSLTPCNLPSPNGGRDVCCHLVNMIEDIDKAAVCCVACHYELSNVTVCQITLSVVNYCIDQHVICMSGYYCVVVRTRCSLRFL